MPDSPSAAARSDLPRGDDATAKNPSLPSGTDPSHVDRGEAGASATNGPVSAANPVPTAAELSARTSERSVGESTLVVADERQMMGLLGSRDSLLRLLEEQESDLDDVRARLTAGLAEARAGERAPGTGADAVRRAFARARDTAAG